jgi:tryptophan synthase alpha chain
MSRIAKLFLGKKKQVLNIYCTAGYPHANSLPIVLQALQKHGADLVEIGMPYSDPLADGPVIQASSARALANGMTISALFGQIRKMRTKDYPGGSIEIPVLLMGYLNPVLQYGFEKFCIDAAASGIDGLIIPDLPIYEFESEYGKIIRKQKLDFIFLVTPETSDARIRKLDSLSDGFLYAVSSSSTTGKDKNINDQSSYFEKLHTMSLKNPILAGFGIKDKQTFKQASEYLNGAIIGSAYIKALESGGDIDQITKTFLDGIIE